MLKNITLSIIALILSGVGLTLWLPDYDISQRPDNNPAANWQLNQSSLDSPLPVSLTRLPLQPTQEDAYAIQLGMFGELQQAINEAGKHPFAQSVTIVKIKDHSRFWYTPLVGPFTQKAAAQDALSEANSNETSVNQATSKLPIVRWPLTPETNESAEG